MLVSVPRFACDEKSLIAILACGQFFMGLMSGGDLPIPSELTTNYPATIYSLTNMVAMTSGFISPYVIGLILEAGPNKLHQWQTV